MLKKYSILFLMLCIFISGCTNSHIIINNINNLEGKKVGIYTGSEYDQILSQKIKDAIPTYYNSYTDEVMALKSGKIDAFLADEPLAKEILKNCDLYNDSPTLIACPTCGRTQIDLIPIAKQMEEFLQNIHSNITVAVMGCAVNGPGEAREADIGIAGGIGEGLLFKKGKIIKKVKEEELVKTLQEEILKMI